MLRVTKGLCMTRDEGKKLVYHMQKTTKRHICTPPPKKKKETKRHMQCINLRKQTVVNTGLKKTAIP